MAKKDNDLNIRMAEASLHVAEASQRDNAAMKAIAEDSKQVALNTSRDSAAMRTIAAMTMVFLPATFTAVSSHMHPPSPIGRPTLRFHRLSSGRVSSTFSPRTTKQWSPGGFGCMLL
ncbi:hypothetical protein K469DRAFT_711724 [Zopfia rhizophila CBS 207.26]|uniref:Uncharacterized protein n=1 Tax=Zopfia rhizophila CBS 207.26 TaxID=1314779 RepID=A0A6A6DX54_9PEZI|nr:hypothetical protein K469DRAFT_711724 [Zopfia rhizophila CBS 207.26]